MDKELISVEPEIIQFGSDSKQLIKVINRSNQIIQNCFFCLFNTSKYQFSPDSFSLQPREHKLISLTLKLKLTDPGGKQFAYLKSKGYNKRLTLITSRKDVQLQDRQRSSQEGMQEINTLTSRDYKQNQKVAYQKIIGQKQAYISTLQRQLEQKSHLSFLERENIQLQNNKFYLDQIQKLQLQIEIMKKQKEQLILDNIQAHTKFKEFKIFVQSQGKNTQLSFKLQQAQAEIKAQAEQIKYLETQCEQFLQKIQEKQVFIKDMEFNYATKIDGIIREGQKKLQQMEFKIQQERRNLQSLSKVSEQTQRLKQKYQKIEQELSKKQKQLNEISEKLDQEKHLNRKLSSESKKALKSLAESQAVAEQNKQLQRKLDLMQRTHRELKQETIIYKNKLTDHDTSIEKMHQYLQMALESCKNQNAILKKNKEDLENSLAEQEKSRRFYESKVQSLQQSVRDGLSKIKQLQEQKDKINSQKLAERDQSHDKIMQLKSENIDLMEKINVEKRKQKEKSQQIQQGRKKISEYQREFEKIRKQFDELEQQHRQTLQQKQKVQKKIEKYRREAKKSIRTISDNAKDELKRIQEQKNQLQKKVSQLQLSARDMEGSQNEQRNKTRTQHEDHKKTVQKIPYSLEVDRRIGIKSQRRSLEESQSNSRSQIDMDKVYVQLGQLREFKNYVANQIKKLRMALGIYHERHEDQNAIQNPIFSAMNFFKDLQHKLPQEFANHDKLFEAQKQIQFLKGRLTELQPIAKNLKQKRKKPQEQSINSKQQIDLSALEYIRQQMKNQYKKLYDSLKLSEQKYQIMRKKVYEEYRARIIQLLSKKDRDEYTIGKIQTLLERFIEGLGNTSHKEAILAKEVKLKQQAKREASILKQKISTLNKQIQSNSTKKRSSCVREPMRLLDLENQNQWLDNIKMQAKLLTFEAQNARLQADKTLTIQKSAQAFEQLKLCQADLQLKQQEIARLKKQVIQITKQHGMQCEKMEQELEVYRKKFATMQKMEKQISDLQIKQKQNNHLRDEIQEKRQIIKNLRDRQRMLEQLLDQSKKNQLGFKQRERKDYLEESRMQESLKDLKQNNRQLRTENGKLKEQIDELIKQMNKKNVAMKRLKSQTEEHRIRHVKSEVESIEKLREEIANLKQELKKSKQESEKLRRKKERQISELQSEINRLKSQFSIEKSSLQSIARALVDTMKGIYCSLDIIVRKKGKIVSQQPNFDSLTSNPTQIRTTKLRKHFDDVIELLKE